MNINCVSNDFWEKPFTIDFTDKKFGYCVLAVFSKKGVFQRTYMIPHSARAKIIDRKNPYSAIDSMAEKNPKAYSMCINGACSFDNERAIMAYYNKSEENFSKKKVYAIYFNLYKIFCYDMAEPGSFSRCINYIKQLYGDETELSDSNIDEIFNDLADRVSFTSLHYLTGHFNYSNFKVAGFPYGSEISNLRSMYSLFDVYQDGTQNTVLAKNKQIICAAYGVKANEFDSAYLSALTHNILAIASKTDFLKYRNHSGVTEYTNILVNHYILGIKCFYHFYMDALLEHSDSNSLHQAYKNILDDYCEKNKVNLSFYNDRIVLNSFLSSLKLMAVIRASERIFGKNIGTYGDCLIHMKYGIEPRSIVNVNDRESIFSEYFHNKAEFLDMLESSYLTPSKDYYLNNIYYYAGCSAPMCTCLPELDEHTRLYRSGSDSYDFYKILRDLRYVFGNGFPSFPIYDGKICALLFVSIEPGVQNLNAIAKLERIFISGGDV